MNETSYGLEYLYPMWCEYDIGLQEVNESFYDEENVYPVCRKHDDEEHVENNSSFGDEKPLLCGEDNVYLV